MNRRWVGQPRAVVLLMHLIVVALTLPSLVRAQNPRGTLRGSVQDASGARVPGARIVVQAANSSAQREVLSDASGEFRIDELQPDLYRVTVQAKGFADAGADVKVAVSSVREITVTLKLAALKQETITLDGAESITTQRIDTEGAVHQTVITSQDLETVPLAGRSFANIAYMAPGTEPVEPSDPTKARITAVSTGGSSGLNNDLSVDGGDNSDDWIGGFLQNYSPEAIQEFAVATAQEGAEVGRTTAAAVVISTKSGTNEWHGDEAFYERDAALNARFPIDNPAPNPKQPFSRQNYVGTLGGPIVNDKVWVFGSLEYVHENASIAYSANSLTEFNALAQLAQRGLINVNGAAVNSIAVPSSVPIPFRDYLGLLRFDWAQSDRSHWFLRSSFDSYTTHNALVQQATLPSSGATTHNNYFSLVASNQFTFSPSWVGSLLFSASGLHLTQSRNSHLGFALAFPFSTTTSTISGFETFGDQQFVTAITAFPIERNQEKYQLRYDVSHLAGRHDVRFGVNFIHEPVLSGALAANAETVVTYPQDPSFYVANSGVLATCSSPTPDPNCPSAVTTGPSDGSFSQSIRRLGFYGEDSWRATKQLTINLGLRYDTTYGLFIASGHDQSVNPSLPGNGIVSGIPHDYRKAFAPRLGLAYQLGDSGKTVLRGGVGLYYADLAQNGWVEAFTAVNPGNLAAGTSPPSLIDPNYTTPYALHTTAGIQHAFNANWTMSADYTLETGMHGYRRYDYPNVSIFRTDNRSSYKALMFHLQGNVAKRLSLVANYTLASAKTWGCQIGELFDYVNGVCDPFNPFASGDYGPSGEDVRHRGVIIGTVHAPGGLEASWLFQAESARPITLITPATGNRAVINGVETSLDEFRGAPYVQVDMRVSRPIRMRERWTLMPFAEFFNLFNRNNPGNNYIPDISAIPTPVNNISNVTSVCLNPPACTQNRPVTSGNQLLFPAGALGDFFGPGTTVGIPFAAQIGVKLTF
ncbi:MAG TPA: TonB-dependent receptor [Candidatus Angelobacter sp.]|nr:TonB-dependent receptor [Candidatus Angelobacter sp.]